MHIKRRICFIQLSNLNQTLIDPAGEESDASEHTGPCKFAAQGQTEWYNADLERVAAALDCQGSTGVSRASAAAVQTGHADVRVLNDAWEPDRARKVGHDVIVNKSQDVGRDILRVAEATPSRNDSTFSSECETSFGGGWQDDWSDESIQLNWLG